MSYDINYLSKDFDSIVDSLIDFATTNYGSETSANRQWTNFNTSSFSRTWLEIVAYIGDQLFFYLDNNMTQSFLETTFLKSVALKIAREYNYEVSSLTSATADVTFVNSLPVIIPAGFSLSATNGTNWFTVQELTIGTVGSGTVGACEGKRYNDTFTSLGLQNESVNLNRENIVVDSTNSYSILLSPVVVVSGNTYTKVNTWINSIATDYHYLLEQNDDGTYTIYFGDGIFGRKLTAGETISVTYRTSEGTEGNVDAATITILSESLAGLSSVTNAAAASGGSNEPTLERLKQQIPASISTLERAVTLDDYSELILANFNEVLQSKAEVNNDLVTIDANIYILPSADSVTQITTNTTLKNSIEDFIDIRKMVTATYDIKDAYGVDIEIIVELFLNTNVSRDLVTSEIQEVLTDFFNLQTGDIDESGTKFAQKIKLNTIYNLIEEIDGIDRFEIKKFTYKPRVEENIQGTTDYTYTNIETYNGVEEKEWLVGLNDDYTSSVFKRIIGTTTAISQESITDNQINVEKASGTGTYTTKITYSASLAFVDSNPDTITDAASQFLVKGFMPGMQISVSGTVSNNGVYTISTVTAGTITLISSDTLTAEGAVACTVNSLDNYIYDYTNTYIPGEYTGTAATGTITCVAANDILNGENFILNDGLGNSVTFEFNSGAVTETATLRRVVRTPGETDAQVAGRIVTAITTAYGLGYINITAIASTALVALTNDYNGRQGNQTIIETVGNAGFIVNGMSGGQKSYLLVDASNYIWQIIDNDSHVFKLNTEAINDITGAINPTSGSYSIVESMIGSNLLINGVIVDSILYNTKSTFFCSTSTFVDTFGAIGDTFYISQKQNRQISTLNSGYIINGTTNITAVSKPSAQITRISFAGKPIPANLALVGYGLSSDWVFMTESSSTIYKFEIINIDLTVGLEYIELLHSNSSPTLTTSTTGIMIQRYYDDDNTISFCLGTADSSTCTVPPSGDCLDYGTDTNGDKVDYFIFRTSSYCDDIVNLRNMEIPEISTSDITLDLRGGV